MRPSFSSAGFALAMLGVLSALAPGFARGAGVAPTLDGSIVRHASQILPEPDGSIIAVGEPTTAGTPLAVVQFLPDGKVDRTFDASGLGLLALDSMARLTNGKLLFAGTFANAAGQPSNRLVKLNRDGSVDTGFQPRKAFAASPIVQSDGLILLLGATTGADGAAQPTLTRLHAGGSADTRFQAGVALLPGSVYALRVQPDGKLLLLGRNGVSTGQPSLERLESNGAPDRQFRAAGQIMSGYGVCALAFAPDGKLLVAEYADGAHDACTLSRLEADGSLDPAFPAAVPVNGRVDRIAQDVTGQVVLSGAFSAIGGVAEPGFARLKNNGVVDTAFNPLGNSGTGVYSFVIDRYGSVTFRFPVGSGWAARGGGRDLQRGWECRDRLHRRSLPGLRAGGGGERAGGLCPGYQ